MFFLGLVSLLQMTVLPGWVWLRSVGVRTQNRCEEGLYCFAASLILNHWLVYLLTAIGQNNRSAWLALVAVEAGLLVFLIRPRTWPRLVPVPQPEATQEASSLARVGLAALAVVSLIAFVPLVRENWGTVFISNDDVASWDRWAQDWFLNRLPQGSHLYPQMLPANWSITYALMGTADVKMFAKAIMPVFAAGVLLLFVSLAWKLGDLAYLAGCTITGLLFLQYLGRDFLMTGYVDVALAFFCFLAFYSLYRDDFSKPPADARLLMVFFATGAAITKQGGLLILAAAALYAVVVKRNDQRESGPTRALRWSTGLAIAFVMLWYLPKFYADRHGGSNLHFLLQDIHEGRNYAERIWFGCQQIMEAGGRPGVLFFAAVAALTFSGLFFSETRKITLGIALPIFLLWGAFFSYEIRTVSMVLPFVGLICGLALRRIGINAIRTLRIPWPSIRGAAAYWTTGIALMVIGVVLYYSGDFVPRIRINYAWPMILTGVLVALVPAIQVTVRLRMELSTPALTIALVVLAGVAVWPLYPSGRLVEQQLTAQRLMGNPAVNARLYHLRDAGQLSEPVLSNYWYLYFLPELKPLARQLSCDRCTVSAILADVTSHKDSDLMLLEDTLLPSLTMRSLEHCAGFETIFVEGTARLFHVNRPQLGGACAVDPETLRPAIERLYPSETRAGVGFNVQSDGSAAIAVGCRNASRTSVVIWAGTTLDSAYGGPNAVTAVVPKRLFSKPGHYAIELLDKDTGLRSAAVDFEVR